jgi:hypothetical protein
VEFEAAVNYPVGHSRDTRCEPEDDEQGGGRTRQTAREQLSERSRPTTRFSRRACVALVAEHRAGYSTPVAAAAVVERTVQWPARECGTARVPCKRNSSSCFFHAPAWLVSDRGTVG